MSDTEANRVAVIGAGVSGVATAVHLKSAGIDVTVFERTAQAGGIWVFNEQTACDPAFPSTLPSTGDSPEFEDAVRSFAPPGPCYVALKNNVSTIEMELTCQRWKPGTEEFVPHHVLAKYIQDTAAAHGVIEDISFNTRVNKVEKVGSKWELKIAKLINDHAEATLRQSTESFDAVVVASGHYHACNVPDIPGLSQWQSAFPSQVKHSKLYRRPEQFRDQNVLLIGAGVSSMDIARDLGPYARCIYQSSRGGPYDLPESMLPVNAARIGGIASFNELDVDSKRLDGPLPGAVTLIDGQKLCDIHQVVVCTGYHVSFPFLRSYHADNVRPEDASEDCLVTNGQQTHNLHKDIFYIPDPTLAFIGVPYHVATFSLFEFQAMVVAAVFSRRTTLPSQAEMRSEYVARIRRKGAGRTFHSLKGSGEEPAYVRELVDLVSRSSAGADVRMVGHSQAWLEAYARRGVRQKAVFSQVRDISLNEKVMALAAVCS
ncbi:hypothetical protein DOTSEDRAFT_58212 [Dothistroma septosporum NZE10]|uniref:FAD dependent oxidoreductase domain-containing protein n=1 Tax=Dothistroma septosporum (strain NZE10 / CBS 128990) TaxID=675120 RepID=N1PZH9_DOTSN|nr:hypothetical protein DOTSEDRAFT_58212 [Dothistroma septosporum NZE10]